MLYENLYDLTGFLEHVTSLATESDYNRERFGPSDPDDYGCPHDEGDTLIAETADSHTYRCERCGLVETFPKMTDYSFEEKGRTA